MFKQKHEQGAASPPCGAVTPYPGLETLMILHIRPVTAPVTGRTKPSRRRGAGVHELGRRSKAAPNASVKISFCTEPEHQPDRRQPKSAVSVYRVPGSNKSSGLRKVSVNDDVMFLDRRVG